MMTVMVVIVMMVVMVMTEVITETRRCYVDDEIARVSMSTSKPPRLCGLSMLRINVVRR